MFSRNITSKILNKRTLLALSGILLSSVFVLPAWGMDPDPDKEGAIISRSSSVGTSKLVRSVGELEQLWERPLISTDYFTFLNIEPSSMTVAKAIDEKPISFTRMSQIHPHLKKVWITTMYMGSNDRGWLRLKELAEDLKTNKTIKELRISKCGVDNKGARYLANMLKLNNTLETLCLNDNAIGNVGAGAFAEGLLLNTTLKALSLEKNKITDYGMSALRGLFAKQKRTFQLDLDNKGKELSDEEIDEGPIQTLEGHLNKERYKQYLSRKKPNNKASVEEILITLFPEKELEPLTNSTFLSVESKEWITITILQKAEKQELREFLSKQNLFALYRAIREAGNQASDEELVRYIFEQNAYTGWETLLPENRAWVVAKIPTEIEKQKLTKILSKEDCSIAYRSIINSGDTSPNEDIIKRILEQKGYQKWDSFTVRRKLWVVNQVIFWQQKNAL